MKTLHSHPERALLLIDLINDFCFPGGNRLARQVRGLVDRVLDLRNHCDARNWPVIYVNDNFGRWRSSFEQTIARCLAAEAAGRDLVHQMHPLEGHYFVLKPHLSGFYHTPLEPLLNELQPREIIVSGVTTDACVLATVTDAHVRKLPIAVAIDAVAAITPGNHEQALAVIKSATAARLVDTATVLGEDSAPRL